METLMAAAGHTRTYLRNDALGLLLLGLTLALAPLVPRLPPWLMPVLPLLVGWRAALELRRRPLPPRFLLVALALAGLAAVLVTSRDAPPRDTALALLAFVTGLKLLEMGTDRDRRLVVLLGYFLVYTNLLYSQTIPTALYGVAVVLLLTAVGVSLADAGGRRAAAANLGTGAALLAQAAPLALVLFVLFPRLSAPLWGVTREATGVSGLSGSMEPGSISRLVLSEEVAFRAEFFDPAPGRTQRYWRGPVFERTDGLRWWERTAGAAAAPPPAVGEGGGVRQVVTLEPTGSRWLLALDVPATAPPGAQLGPDRVLTLRRPVRGRLRYTVASQPRLTELSLDSDTRRRCLEVPASVSPRVRALAQGWVSRPGTGRKVVGLALRHFREEPFVYTLAPPPLPGDAVDGFLFETRRGFCEHFAGAFTLLLRLAGVPARVVTGYLGGEHNPLGDYWIVRQSDAHAWSEVWLAGEGWVRVDPTAAVAPERVERGLDPGEAGRGVLAFAPVAPGLLRNLWRLWDSSNNVWNQWVLGYGRERQLELLARLGFAGLGRAGLALAAAVAVAATLGALGVTLTLRRRRPEDPAQRQYLHFCRRLERLGLPRRPHEGPRAYAERVASARPDLGGAARDVSALYASLRYGKPLPDRERRLALRRLAGAARRGLRGRPGDVGPVTPGGRRETPVS